MTAYNSFEDLPVWQYARELGALVCRATAEREPGKENGLRDQIQKTAISVSSNIAGGFERGSKRDFIQFLQDAKSSCGELRSQLYIAKDLGYLDKENYETLIAFASNTSKQISGFIKDVQSSEFAGHKFEMQQSETRNIEI